MSRPPSNLWVRPNNGETGLEFANRVFNELGKFGWYVPGGDGDPDDSTIPWHWTREGLLALERIDVAIGVQGEDGRIRPTEAIRLLDGFALERSRLASMVRAADAAPPSMSDDAIYFCAFETLNLMKGYGLRTEVTDILRSRRPKAT